MAEMKKGGLLDGAGSEWEESKHPRDEAGKFTSGSSTGDGFEKEKSITDAASSEGEGAQGFGGSSAEEFAGAIKTAKATISPEAAWRVTAHTQEELDRDYPGAKLHVTEGGSTVAVTADGDIMSLCRNRNDKATRGKELLKQAVENGGKKLDAFGEDLYEFYTQNGFEPISWTPFNEDYAPKGWEKVRDKKEPIVFYKYTGKQTKLAYSEFINKINATPDYETAQGVRDKEIKK